MSLSGFTSIVLALLAVAAACTPSANQPPRSTTTTAGTAGAETSRITNCKTMRIPRNAELDTNLDLRRRTIEVAYLGDEGVDEEFMIRYANHRCVSNPDAMRVITHVLRTAGVPVPMPSMNTRQMMKCPPSRRLHRSWYVAYPCSSTLTRRVGYEFYLSTSCSELPDFDGTFWNLHPAHARQHGRHLSGHHGLNGTVTLTAPNEAVFRSKRASIRLYRHQGGDRACARD